VTDSAGTLVLVKRTLCFLLLGLVGWALACWAFGALWFDAAPAAAWGFLAALIAALLVLRRTGRAWFVPFAGFAAVLFWWLTLAPSHDRRWSSEYSRLPRALIDGDTVTLSNVRNFDYPPEGDPVPRWETRTFKLADVEAMDLAVNYWGSPWIAHPIVIFRFKNAPPLAFSIETRREEGEDYSALAGFYRQYELIVLAGDERDLLGVRTCHRQGEDVYLYATTAIRGMNQGARMPFDWRLLINGKGDEMLHERGLLRSGGLSFAELKRKAWTNPAAMKAFDRGDFSDGIRRGRPEFATGP
jgi:hypothetical protein